MVWLFIKRWTDKLSKVITPLVTEIEKMAIDGVIDKAERKTLAVKAIALLEQQGTIKLNIITRFVAHRIVNRIASRLPDFKISLQAQELLEKAKG